MNTNLSSYFNKYTIDNNGEAIIDINDGLNNLFLIINNLPPDFTEQQRYLVSEFEEGYPDLVARNSLLNSTEYWWWMLLINRLEDPFSELLANWVYSINSPDYLNSTINEISGEIAEVANIRSGEVIELN